MSMNFVGLLLCILLSDRVQRGNTFSSTNNPPVITRQAQLRRKNRSQVGDQGEKDLTTLTEQRQADRESTACRQVNQNGQLTGSEPPTINVLQASPALKRMQSREQNLTGSESSSGDALESASPLIALKVKRTVSLESTGSGTGPQTPDLLPKDGQSDDLALLDSQDITAVVSTAYV